ncbi:MAG: hypothetical protein AAF718_05715 [Pseudomonadota bacterium]
MTSIATFLIYATLGILILVAYRTFVQGAEAQGHHADQFDAVMAGRYAFMAFAFGCALLSGLPWMILSMLAAFAGLAFWDAYVYGQATKETDLHLYAGIGAIVVFFFYGLSVVTSKP